jgi:hypothetical protein
MLKKNVSKLVLAVVLMLLGSLPALAIIDKIEVRTPTPQSGGYLIKEYQPNETVPVPMIYGEYMLVYGGGTDLATSIDAGSGVNCKIEERKHGIGSYIGINCEPSNSASTAVRTLKIKYPVGEDSFKIRVQRVGTISRIQYDPSPTPTTSMSGAVTNVQSIGSISGVARPTGLQPAIDLPKNVDIVLVITGTKLRNVRLGNDNDYSGSVLPGATDTQCRIKIKFTRSGTQEIKIVDVETGGGPYKGANSRSDKEVDVSGSTGGSYNTATGGIVGGGTSSGSTFMDVAPRANMLNIFRRLSNFAPFTIGGTTFLTVNNQHCQGMTPNQSREITIPDLTWGVTNVGTQAINQAFDVVLKTGSGTILDTQTVTNLAPGATQNFTFHREKSEVRVRTRSDRQGCFISPNDAPDFYFEDSVFTVQVDTTAVLGEDGAKRANNSRNF